MYHQSKVAELKSLESICAYASTKIIAPITEPIIEETLPQIQNPDISPMEQLMIIKLISKLALSTQINFEPFYSSSMIWLNKLVQEKKMK